MVRTVYNRGFLKLTHIWFADHTDTEIKSDVIYYHELEEGMVPLKSYKTTFHTLISDLCQSKEEVHNQINKNVRYEIRRSNKEEVESKFFSSADLQTDKTIIAQFCDIYESMYREKGMQVKLNKEQFDAYLKQNSVVLTCVMYQATPIVFHSYIVDDKHVRLWHSASEFRKLDMDAAMIARANKRLHWDDMCEFKKREIKSYDWGGISSFDAPNGIDEFKMKFGGEKVTYYNAVVGKTLFGKAAVWILRLKDKESKE